MSGGSLKHLRCRVDNTPESWRAGKVGAVDTRVLADLGRLGGIEFVTEMLAMAVDSMHGQIDELLNASDAGDFQGIARAAHALISSSGSVGAERIHRIAAAVEGRTERGLHDPAASDMTHLRVELAIFEEEVSVVYPVKVVRSPSHKEGGAA
jgi:HPt (histidine-containing phosphotransfer) domain-containing protein